MTTESKLGAHEAELRQRAQRVIPNGMYGHQSVRQFPPGYPQFFAGASGAMVTDVDGREYVDLMCGYGPMVLGHRHRTVEAAAAAQRQRVDCLHAPTERLVEAAECLTGIAADASWAMFAKNGTDATTGCLTIARAATGRSLVLAARGSYHGAAPWCSPVLDGVLPSDRAAVRYFEYNDMASLEQALADAGDDLAAILVTPFKHIEGLDQELVRPEFAARLRRACDERGALLVLDDVRCGLRLHLGGSWEPIGVPVDLSAWSKGIANGYPLAAVTGTDRWREAAGRVFFTGSFWTAAVPMAAMVATVEVLATENGVARIGAAGDRLRAGIEEQAASRGVAIRYTGHQSMPYVTFDGDSHFERMDVFAVSCLEAGLYLAPRHNWFLSLAHTDEVVDRALQATDRAMEAVSAAFPS